MTDTVQHSVGHTPGPTKPMRFVTATVDGHRYEIPEMWLIGASAGGLTLHQAVQHWHDQRLAEMMLGR